MAKSAAFERCQYRAAVRDYAMAYNAKTKGWHLSGRKSFPNLHMRRKHPGWMREAMSELRRPRPTKNAYKGYAPLMDGTRLAEPKWLQDRRRAQAVADAQGPGHE